MQQQLAALAEAQHDPLAIEHLADPAMALPHQGQPLGEIHNPFLVSCPAARRGELWIR